MSDSSALASKAQDEFNVLFSCGNAPGLPTGYGGQCLLALRAFLKAGAKKVYIIAWNLSGSQFKPLVPFTTEEVCMRNPQMQKIFDAKGAEDVDWASVYWFSNPYQQWPTTIRKHHLNEMIARSRSSFFVSLQDIFMFEPGAIHCLSAVWMPLHFVPVEHPTVLALADFDMQLPISGWGACLLEPLQRPPKCARHIDVVAHGRCTKTYSPDWDNEEEKKRTRFLWGWPQDAFVILLIASNSEESGRKAFDAQLQAFSAFKAIHSNAWLHIHAESVRAYDIPRLLETFGEFDGRSTHVNLEDHRARTFNEAPVQGERVSMTPSTSLNSVSEEGIAKMYRASDVLLAATCSEGCGVPILEAQFCGCPVVTTRATAMWEETHLGISVKPVQWIARMDFNSGWMLPNVPGIVEALSEIYTWTKEQRRQKYEKIKNYFTSLYSNEAIIQKWQDIVQNIVIPEVSSDFQARKLKVSEPRKIMLRLSLALQQHFKVFGDLQEEAQENIRDMTQRYSQKKIIDYIKSAVPSTDLD
jgi:glycosyltransferase involved in cell wall biosynthesis